jgi:hypothetical protein
MLGPVGRDHVGRDEAGDGLVDLAWGFREGLGRALQLQYESLGGPATALYQGLPGRPNGLIEDITSTDEFRVDVFWGPLDYPLLDMDGMDGAQPSFRRRAAGSASQDRMGV